MQASCVSRVAFRCWFCSASVDVMMSYGYGVLSVAVLFVQ